MNCKMLSFTTSAYPCKMREKTFVARSGLTQPASQGVSQFDSS